MSDRGDHDRPQTVSLARVCVAALAALCSFQFAPVRPLLLVPGVMTALVLAVLVLLATRNRLEVHRRPVVAGLAVVVAAGVCANAGVAVAFGASPGWAVPAALAMVFGAAGATWAAPGRNRLGSLVVLLAGFTALAVASIRSADIVIDVERFLAGGIDAMLRGTSPYAIVIDDPYSPAQSALFYGPGVVRDGIVQYGFPYLPAPLVLDVPAHLLGDARWMHVAATVAAAAIAWNLAGDRLGRLAAALVVCSGISVSVMTGFWVEPVIVLLLALSVLCVRSRTTWAAVPLGLLFASKQYALAFVPALLTVAKVGRWRTVVLAVVVGLVVLVPFVLWDAHAFVRSAVELQLIQPFRDDAVSWLPGLKEVVGTPPGWVLSLSPLLGAVTSLLVVRHTRPGPTALALGVGLGLLVTVLTSKVGFVNYYQLIGAALALATVTWTDDDPVRPVDDVGDQTREPSSQGSRGERGISRTR